MPSAWRREALRTNLWLVPTVEIVLSVTLFVVTYALDRAAYDGTLSLPSFVNSGSADAAREILTAIAAAVITVVTLVFSITIVTLTLASTQFGPRMLRNFIRDRITQFTLGSFVATFVYSILVLVSIGPGCARGLRSASVDYGVPGAGGRGRRGAGGVHRSHREIDSVAEGYREHRRRSVTGDRS